MIASPQPPRMTPDEYLAWEEKQDIRYEYEHGEIIAMTGGTIPHSDLAVNLLLEVGPHVRRQGCRINNSDAKVQVREAGPYYYPDVTVSCDERDLNAVKVIRYPKVIFEVLSPSTELRDRNKKFKEFQRSETLEEYVLLDYRLPRVECFRRSEGRFWRYGAFNEGEVVQFESLDFKCPIETIYRNVVFDKPV